MNPVFQALPRCVMSADLSQAKITCVCECKIASADSDPAIISWHPVAYPAFFCAPFHLFIKRALSEQAINKSDRGFWYALFLHTMSCCPDSFYQDPNLSNIFTRV